MNLGIDRPRAAEQFVAVVLIEELERMTIIIRHRIDAREIPLVFVSADIISIDAADQHVARETLVSELVGVVDDPEKEATIDDKHIRERIDRTRVFVAGKTRLTRPPLSISSAVRVLPSLPTSCL